MDADSTDVNAGRTPMPTEIELKYRVETHEPVRQRLRSLGALRGESWLECNRLFDTPGGRLRAADCGLRLRTARGIGRDASIAPAAVLTFKGPRQSIGADCGPKRRSEFETAIDDPDTLAELLTQLGLREAVVYEKRRECWHLGSVEIVLDELPRLGRFVEIEGQTTDGVVQVREQLALPREGQWTETYVELAARHGAPRSDGCIELRF
jgi:adenylate cyclase class 2